jgi:hypothetical protein
VIKPADYFCDPYLVLCGNKYVPKDSKKRKYADIETKDEKREA